MKLTTDTALAAVISTKDAPRDAKFTARDICGDYVHVFADRDRGHGDIFCLRYTVYPTKGGGAKVTGGNLPIGGVRV